MTVHFGIIGCGYISKRHIEALAAVSEAKLIAVSDINSERMNCAIHQYQKLSNKYHLIKPYKNYIEMLESKEIDAVIICTISGLHAEMAKIALIEGKHVILEKPMTLSLKEADKIIQLSKVNKRKVSICHQMRFRPIMKKVKEIIKEGKLGKIYLGIASIRLNRSSDYYSQAVWRGDWEKDGGMLVNQGIHLIDLLQWFLGDVQKVYGDISRFSMTKETEDIALGVLSFSNRAKGLIEANVITQPKNLGYQLSIFGEKGCISIEGPSLNKLTRWHIDGEETDYKYLNDLLNDENEQIYMYENFIQSLQDPNENLLIDGVEGRKALETIFAIYQSYLIKQSVDLPLDSFSTKNMKM